MQDSKIDGGGERVRLRRVSPGRPRSCEIAGIEEPHGFRNRCSVAGAIAGAAAPPGAFSSFRPFFATSATGATAAAAQPQRAARGRMYSSASPACQRGLDSARTA
jgi:hypothetical protein